LYSTKKFPVLLLAGLAFGRLAIGQSQPAECTVASAGAIATTTATAAQGSADRTSRLMPATSVAAQIAQRRPVPVRSTSSCQCGRVQATSLTAKSASQQVPILTGLSGSFRFDHVLLRETEAFGGSEPGKVTVGVGRANGSADVITPFPLRNATAPWFFWYERPSPPQLAGAYDLVLYFEAAFPLGDGTLSNLKAGALTWEVCGFNGSPVTDH